jgi:hypothetical protein
MKISKRKATTLYEQTRVTTLKNFDVDLADIRNDCDQRLQEARDKAQLEVNAIMRNANSAYKMPKTRPSLMSQTFEPSSKRNVK